MGLSGVKKKQVISADPQNLQWKNDKSSFGFKMLQKMGWTEGKGLGLNEDGDTNHIKIKLKEDNYGLGADIRTVDNWLGNTSAFSLLLQSLNSTASTVSQGEDKKKRKSKSEKLEKKSKSEKSHKKSKSEKLEKKETKKDEKVVMQGRL